MIMVRVELHPSNGGGVTELARMKICNDGSVTGAWGNYKGETYRGRNAEALNQRVVQREGQVTNFPRQSTHVWVLIARMLARMGYR